MDQTETPQTHAHLNGLERMLAWMRGERAFEGLFALLQFAPVSVEHGRVVIGADPTPDHFNTGGSVHGGFTAALLDTAMGCAAVTMTGPRQFVTTMELKCAYHRRITLASGRIEATGTVLSHGKRAVFAEARVTDSRGQLVASGSSTLMILER